MTLLILWLPIAKPKKQIIKFLSKSHSRKIPKHISFYSKLNLKHQSTFLILLQSTFLFLLQSTFLIPLQSTLLILLQSTFLILNPMLFHFTLTFSQRLCKQNYNSRKNLISQEFPTKYNSKLEFPNK